MLIKSPVYVAIHHIKGEGLNPKRISQIVLTNEVDEYLKYFPEDAQHFEPYIAAHQSLVVDLASAFEATAHITDQKDFAMAVKALPYSGILFTCKKLGVQPLPTFNGMADAYKIKVLEGFVE